MIRVDPRAGSGEFERLLVRAGAPVKRPGHQLAFADFCFWGNYRGRRVRVGVERKTISEILSAVGDNRFVGHQLPGLLTRYPQHAWLVVEGNYYPDKHGVLRMGRRVAGFGRTSHLYENVEKFLLSLELEAGLHVKRTNGKTHTTLFLKSLYDWYQKTKHSSVYKVDETKPDAVMFERRTMKRKVANQLTGLAWHRSVKADVYFPSIVSMVTGDPGYPSLERAARARSLQHWQQALGFKKGTKIARAIVDVCYGRDEVPGKGRG